MASRPRFNRKAHDAGLKHGWRSGLEETVCKALAARQVPYEYETLTITFTPRPKRRRYTPDVLLLNNYIILETKGRFVTADRQKHLDVQAEYPDLDIRFVFSNARARISKTSKTTYAVWCESHGFKYSDKGVVPESWLREPVNTKAKAVILKLIEGE